VALVLFYMFMSWRVYCGLLAFLAIVGGVGARTDVFERKARTRPVPVGVVPWAVPDAPYRVLMQLERSPNVAGAGVAIELADFGQMKPDLSDVVLTDAEGGLQPVNPMWLRAGARALLLAQELRPRETYAVYFGGGKSRERRPWTPGAMSLLMETRRLAGGAKFNNWREMLDTWQRSGPVEGMGFVSQIFHGENPFGENHLFATHYSGYLLTENVRQMRLYTLSSDASFVLVNGQCVLSAPGTHAARGNEKNTPMATVKASGPLTRIDYYHVKADDGNRPVMTLGWQDEHPQSKRELRLHGYGPIPPSAWAHSGEARVVRVEGRDGRPAPAPQERISSYIGYNDAWFYDVTLSAPALPTGWTAEWEFADGATRTGAVVTRVLVANAEQRVVLRLKHGDETLTGVRLLEFRNDLPQASLNRSTDIKRYVALLAEDDPSKLPPVAVSLVKEFGTLEQFARIADGYLRRYPDSASELWAAAQEARIRWMAQTNALQALAAVRNLPSRPPHIRRFNDLEIDLLLYYVRDVSAAVRIETLADPAVRQIRLGDLCRLAGNIPQAIEFYRAAQRAVADKTDGRKLPSQDRAFSLLVSQALARDDRDAAAVKLAEWERVYPLAKIQSDFLLLRARMLMAYGRPREALAELDSFRNIHAEGPLQIEAVFYRAYALSALGKKDEARALWDGIAKNYPKHPLASEAARLAR